MAALSKRFLAFLLLIVVVVAGGSLAHWRARTAAAEAGGPGVPGVAASVGPMAAGSGAAAASSGNRVAASAASGPVAGAAPDAEDIQIPSEGLEVCGVRRLPADELRRWKADPVLRAAEAQRLQVQMQEVGKAGLAGISARLAAGNERQQVAARLLMRDTDGAALLAERSSDAQA